MSVSSHYAAGYALGLLWRFAPMTFRRAQAKRLDRWGYRRELRQKRESGDQTPPYPKLSEHQLYEAYAWADGFCAAARIERV